MNQEVTQYIAQANETQQEILQTLRDIIHKHVPLVQEDFKWSRPIFKAQKNFAYIQANAKHVNLGFYEGFEKLPDPTGKLEGTGKMMRHIKIRSSTEIDAKELGEWLKILTE